MSQSTLNPVLATKWLGPLAGSSIIALASVSYVTRMPLTDMLLWAQTVFGWGFVAIYLALILVAVIAFQRLSNTNMHDYWHEVGQQVGNGLATLALTFTLLGISLGIGTLSDQALTPASIQGVIGNLTKQFSSAFMTTVVGLPTATIVRAAFAVRYQKCRQITSESGG